MYRKRGIYPFIYVQHIKPLFSWKLEVPESNESERKRLDAKMQWDGKDVKWAFVQHDICG